MKRFATLAILLSTLFAMDACKSEYEALLSGNDTNAKYEAAFEYYNQGKYNRAAQLFENLSVMTSGTARDDTVQYYWGMSNYRDKDYFTAQANFESFVAKFPRSPFTENARYLLLDCMYRGTLRYELDQTPTYKCITAISEFIMDYPDNEHMEECRSALDELNGRLDRKAFENARLYYNMEYYDAAGVALRNVLKDNAENRYREEILYLIAMSSYKFADMSIPEKQQERFLVFRDDYLNFIAEYPESSHRRELDTLFKRVRDI